MLFANQFTLDHPVVCLGLDPDSGLFTLWTRQALAELNEKNTVELFARFTKMAELARNWIEVQEKQKGARKLKAYSKQRAARLTGE